MGPGWLQYFLISPRHLTLSLSLYYSPRWSVWGERQLLDIFRSYLSYRTQYVKIDNHLSDPACPSFEVPQGSVLGPTLFLIYVNDLCTKSLPNCKIISYADDMAMLVSGVSFDEARSNSKAALREVMVYLSSNLLTINVDKTKYLLFCLRQSTLPSLNFFHLTSHTCDSQSHTCMCKRINQAEEIKYLGMMLELAYTYQQHYCPNKKTYANI